jgi:hypothetical protein
MSSFDLNRLAERLHAAAERASNLTVTISSTDLILSRDGYGSGRSEGVPFAGLFLRDEDILAKALDRLGC